MLPKLAICPKLAILVAFLAAGPALAASPSPSHRASAAPAPSLASNQFTSEPAAKSHCPGDTIVWANTGSSKAYHLSGSRYFGKTKHGAYMCRKDADTSGFHVAGSRRGTKKSASKTPSTAPTTTK